jgi:hypothetical protein
VYSFILTSLTAKGNIDTHTHTHTHTLNYVLTPWCRVFFEKLIVAQLFKQYAAFFMEPEGPLPCITCHWTLSWASWIQFAPLIPVSLKVHLNVTLPPTHRSSQWSLSFGPPTQNILNTSFSPSCVSHVAVPFHMVLVFLTDN